MDIAFPVYSLLETHMQTRTYIHIIFNHFRNQISICIHMYVCIYCTLDGETNLDNIMM